MRASVYVRVCKSTRERHAHPVSAGRVSTQRVDSPALVRVLTCHFARGMACKLLLPSTGHRYQEIWLHLPVRIPPGDQPGGVDPRAEEARQSRQRRKRERSRRRCGEKLRSAIAFGSTYAQRYPSLTSVDGNEGWSWGRGRAHRDGEMQRAHGRGRGRELPRGLCGWTDSLQVEGPVA